MSKYKVLILYQDGTEEEDEYVYDTYEEAHERGCDILTDFATGAEVLNMSNPGDYPMELMEDPDFQVIQVDD